MRGSRSQFHDSALSHLVYHHYSLPRTCQSVISHFGIHIHPCTETLAHLHNSRVLKALRKHEARDLPEALGRMLPPLRPRIAFGSSPLHVSTHVELQRSFGGTPRADSSLNPTWPDDLPASLVYRLQAHERARRSTAMPANVRNSQNLFVCPFCERKLKEFARFRYFIGHLRDKHSSWA